MRRTTLTLLALLLGGAQAATLTVSFPAPEGLKFNRRGTSTLTVTSGRFRQVLKLRGVPDLTDPQNTFLRLDAVRLPLPTGLSGPLKLAATLYLCDSRAGVCEVEERQTTVRVRAGQNVTVRWPVGTAPEIRPSVGIEPSPVRAP